MTDVPPQDIDYAVENALWVAHAVITADQPVHRSYLDVFGSQLTTHWEELERLYPKPSDDESDTEQQTLSATTETTR